MPRGRHRAVLWGVARLRKIVLVVLALGWFAPDARAQEDIRVEAVHLPSARLVRDRVYETLIARPAREGRFPLIVLGHGATYDARLARGASVRSWSPIAAGFARQGFVAAFFLRQGYGSSAGELAEGFGSCEAPDYLASAGLIADQIEDVLAALARRDDVDPARIVLLGSSAGGFGALALAARPATTLSAVVNVSGGRGARPGSTVCAEPRLVEAFGRFGRGARAPALWLYAENDSFFRTALAERMFAAWTGAGGKGTLVFTPPFGDDGHFVFSEPGRALWQKPIVEFLKGLGLP
jgi:pimeloyl-ACP methyl ester carboxylesterase